MQPQQIGFLALGLLGLVLTWGCNLQSPLISNMLLQPQVMGNPAYAPHVFGEFYRSQATNNVTTAVWGTFFLAVGCIVIINCRATPGSLLKRLGFHYLALLVAAAFSFPLQCALCMQPETPRSDGILACVSTATIAVVGAFAIFGSCGDSSINLWYFAVTAIVPLAYDRMAGGINPPHTFRMLAAVNFCTSAFLWSRALIHFDGGPFATWFTASIFWDLAICTVCATAWVTQHTNDLKLTVLTMLCPSVGLPLALARIYVSSRPDYVALSK